MKLFYPCLDYRHSLFSVSLMNTMCERVLQPWSYKANVLEAGAATGQL